eukprot:10010818-Alexandrium_andersonii.AAC.1
MLPSSGMHCSRTPDCIAPERRIGLPPSSELRCFRAPGIAGLPNAGGGHPRLAWMLPSPGLHTPDLERGAP